MQLYRNARSPFWWLDATDPATGKRLRVSTREKAKGAAMKAATAIIAARDVVAASSEGGRVAISVEAALALYVAHLTTGGRASAGEVAGIARKLSSKMPGRWGLDGSRWLHSIGPADCEEIVQRRQAEGLAAQSVVHELKTLRAATRFAGGLEYRVPTSLVDSTARNPWRFPKLTPKTRYLSREEWQLVYDRLDPHADMEQSRGGKRCAPYKATGRTLQSRQDAQDLLVALTLCGGRWSEVAGLTWDRVGAPDFTVVRLWGSKTQEERLAPLPAPMRDMLVRRWRYACEDGTAALVFPGRGGAERWACRAISRAMMRTGLNTVENVARHGRATVHSLRHTFASWLIQNGANLNDVQHALGHSSPAMTQRYAHLSKADNAARLGRILEGATT